MTTLDTRAARGGLRFLVLKGFSLVLGQGPV